MLNTTDYCSITDLIKFLQLLQADSAIIKKKKQPPATQAAGKAAPAAAWPGWKGGRPKKQLSDEEKSSIDEMRPAGASINKISKALHISNRVVSEYLK